MTDVPHFPAVTRADWEARAQRELGARPLASLTRTTPEGVAIRPVYLSDDVANLALDSLPGQPPYLRGRSPLGPGQGGWQSIQDYRHADPRLANRAARADLDQGAHGCWFVIDRGLRAGREPGAPPNGLVIDPAAQLDVLLQGIDPSRTPVHIDAGLLAPALIDALEHWWDDHDLPEGASGAAGSGIVYDPLAVLVETGSLACARETALTELVDRTLGTRRGLLGISTAPYHDGGASDAEELALALASSVELMRRGQALGLEPADVAEPLIWTLAIGNEPFLAIAKLRAARLVWTKLALACGLAEPTMPWIRAVPSQRIWTQRAAWLNLLRGTTGCFAAAIGGADSIASAAFDGLCGPEGGSESAGLGRGSELGRRLAINTQRILRDESSLDRVIDPAGGSFYVESLTDALARAAWSRFRVLEREGGLVAGLESGTIQAGIAKAATKLRERVATRKQPITGVSSWPALDEPNPPEQAANRFEGPPPDSSTTITGACFEVAAIPIVRLAAPFEALRAAAEAWMKTHGHRPRIFAATLGPLAHHQARLDFARNLFAAGGIELIEPSDGADRVAAFQASGCELAIVCGRDEDYLAQQNPLVRALFEAGATQVWIAGPPPAEPWAQAPVALRYVFLGCDVVGALTSALRMLGATEGGT